MEFQEIIIIFGLVLISVIIWDGMRRMKRPVKKASRSVRDKSEPYLSPEEATKDAQIERELPGGGARVRSITAEEQQRLKTRLTFREKVPVLMEKIHEKEAAKHQVAAGQQGTSPEMDTRDMAMAHDEPYDTALADSSQTVAQMEQSRYSDSLSDDLVSQLEARQGQPVPDMSTSQSAGVDRIEEEQTSLEPVDDIVIIHVMAKPGKELSGNQVMELLLTAGLRFGPMNIFHYRNPKGVTEFSLANGVHPGTFDPDTMTQVSTPGLSLFMQLPTKADVMSAFNHMYEMAVFMAKHLDAQILDDNHSSVTPQRIEYYRERLRTYSQSRMIVS